MNSYIFSYANLYSNIFIVSLLSVLTTNNSFIRMLIFERMEDSFLPTTYFLNLVKVFFTKLTFAQCLFFSTHKLSLIGIQSWIRQYRWKTWYNIILQKSTFALKQESWTRLKWAGVYSVSPACIQYNTKVSHPKSSWQ